MAKLVIHIKHNTSKQNKIHDAVKPLPHEKVFTKSKVNCFVDTDLQDFLESNNIKKVVVAGMMTHMCVEAAVRAASDMGFKTTVISDACATKDLVFNNKTIKAEDVHLSTLNTLKSYAEVIDTENFIKNSLKRNE